MSAARPVSPLASILPLLIPVFGLLSIAGISGWIQAPLLGVVCRPLTTLLIALHAASRPSSNPAQRRLVLAGLLISVLAECAFGFERTYVSGIVLFVLAQICYLGVSVRAIGLVRPGILHAVHAAISGWAIVMWSVRPLPVFLAVAAFMAVLSLTSVQAETWWLRSRGTPDQAVARVALIACLCWLVADLLWTFSQFVFWVRGTYVIVLTCYFLAQWHLSLIIDAKETQLEPRGTLVVAGHAQPDHPL